MLFVREKSILPLRIFLEKLVQQGCTNSLTNIFVQRHQILDLWPFSTEHSSC